MTYEQQIIVTETGIDLIEDGEYGYDGKIGKAYDNSQLRYTKQFKSWLLGTQRGRCGYCGTAEMLKPHIDHIIPLNHSRHVSILVPSNLMYTCHECNSAKGAEHPFFLRNYLRLKWSHLSGLITPTQALQLEKQGKDLRLVPIHHIRFLCEIEQWHHVYIPDDPQ